MKEARKPTTFDEFVASVMARQDADNPQFATERQLRDYISKNYPAMERNWTALAKLGGK